MNPPTISNIYSALENAIPDPAVGISLAHLAGDEAFSVYGTAIDPGRQLKTHYHQQGSEIYQVISGLSRMLLQTQQGDTTELQISDGDIFAIPPMTAHQLINPGNQPLFMLFSCPQSHITHDRHICTSLISD